MQFKMQREEGRGAEDEGEVGHGSGEGREGGEKGEMATVIKNLCSSHFTMNTSFNFASITL